MSFIRGRRQAATNGFPRPGEETLVDVPSRHSREGWTHMRDHESVYLEGRQYRGMREWNRPCSICGGAMEAFEKIGATDVNSRFSNRTCKEHRGLLPAFERGYLTWDVTSKCVAAGPKTSANGISTTALEELVRNLRDECDAHISFQHEQSARIKELEAELALHKPPTVQDVLKKLPWG